MFRQGRGSLDPENIASDHVHVPRREPIHLMYKRSDVMHTDKAEVKPGFHAATAIAIFVLLYIMMSKK
jgi:hypothetical protein